MRRAAPAALLLAAAFAVLAVVRLQHGAAVGVTPPAQRGGAREMAFPLVEGGVWQLREHRGAVVAVNLWATWCGPCREEVPALNQLADEFGSKQFAIVGVSLDTGAGKRAAVQQFGAAYRVQYPMAFPEPMSEIEAGLEGVPTTLLFDRAGRAAKVYVGAVREATLRADVTALLRETP